MSRPIPDKELSPIVKNEKIKAMLTKIAKSHYPRQWHIALNCLQAGVSIGIGIVKSHNERGEAKE